MCENNKPLLLFVAPDSGPAGLSRAFWLARYLSEHYTVYYTQWQDSRNYYFFNEIGKTSLIKRFFISLSFFLSSLLTKINYKREREFSNGDLILTYIPFIHTGFLEHFSGEILARKITRSFNLWSMKKLVLKHNFTAIIHGDNFMFSPIISKEIPAFIDLQDDFDDKQMTKSLLEYEQAYFSKNVKLCKSRFTINEATAKHMLEYIGFSFDIMPNGVDFSVYNEIHVKKAMELRKQMSLDNKIIVSFVGTNGHFDKQFVEELASKALLLAPYFHFVLVGNLPSVKGSNVTNVGFVNPNTVHLYYLMADIGFMPKAADDTFVSNCHPLKVIQFSAAKKPILLPHLSAFDDTYKNLHKVKFNTELWLEKLIELKDFTWTSELDKLWEAYSWQRIVDRLCQKMNAE